MLCGWQSGQVRGAACSRPVPCPLPHCATAGQSAVTHPSGLVCVRPSADAARVYTERTLWVTVLKSRDGTLAGAPGQQRSDGSRNGVGGRRRLTQPAQPWALPRACPGCAARPHPAKDAACAEGAGEEAALGRGWSHFPPATEGVAHGGWAPWPAAVTSQSPSGVSPWPAGGRPTWRPDHDSGQPSA